MGSLAESLKHWLSKAPGTLGCIQTRGRQPVLEGGRPLLSNLALHKYHSISIFLLYFHVFSNLNRQLDLHEPGQNMGTVGGDRSR